MKKASETKWTRPEAHGTRLKNLVITMILLLTLTNMRTTAQVRNIVLVHGAFADGSGWLKIYKILTAKGYSVSVVGNPDTGLEDDVVATKRVLDRQNGPCILVGHSYGGAIITLAGTHPKVAGLVYISAFAPDEGESLGKLLASYPLDPKAGTLPPVDGYVWYDRAKYHSGFCADLSKDEADFMADSQVPVAASGFGYVFPKEIAWKSKPAWYVVAQEDHSIPPELERMMGKRTGGKVSEIKGSHLIYISHSKEVAAVIESAAKETFHK